MLEPTAKQIHVRDTPDASILITAPAGCGKTEALALRVRGLIDRAARPSGRRILIVTFTNRAKENIQDRLRAYLSRSELSSFVTVHNLHGLSARIVAAHGKVIGLDPDATFPSSDWVDQQLRRTALNYKQRGLASRILQEENLITGTDSDLLERIGARGNRYATSLEKHRQEVGQLTYGDLPRLADLILRDGKVSELYRCHFSSVIVDEFQDLTQQQLSIIQSFGCGNTAYAGDIAQGIYSFAGAQPLETEKSIRREVSSEIKFSESHRSSPAVLSLVNAFLPLTGGTSLSAAKPQTWPGGGLVTHRAFSDEEVEADWILRFSKSVLARASEHRIGVVVRMKNRRASLDEAIVSAEGIPWYRWDDPIFDVNVARLLRGLMSSQKPEELIASSAESVAAGWRPDIASADPDTWKGLVEGVDWVQDEIRAGTDVGDLLLRLKVGVGKSLIDAPGVHLLTGHAGKGQQFDWVVIMGLEEGSLPSFAATTEQDFEEEARVLSVMASRARFGVITTTSKAVKKPWGDFAYPKESRFNGSSQMRV